MELNIKDNDWGFQRVDPHLLRLYSTPHQQIQILQGANYYPCRGAGSNKLKTHAEPASLI
jgi:hypothetical protein